MKVGIDARMFGPTQGGGGLGRYVEQLVRTLPKVDRENRYVLFMKEGGGEEVRSRGYSKKFEIVETNTHWYTGKEQLFLGPLIDRQKLDLVHFPHWNVPMNMKTPFVVTIHDLILLEQPRSAHASTRHPLVYTVKYWGYKRVLQNTIKRSRHIIAVSNYTKDAILKFFPDTDPNKITVVYEGLVEMKAPDEPIVWGESRPTTEKVGTRPVPTPRPYLLSVGNSYPHKNIPRLIQAFEQIAPMFPDINLVLAGRRDTFFDQIGDQIKSSPANNRIKHIANPTDEALQGLYRHAAVYVFPSLSEGFGLPPLEAMQFDVPVVSSRATCLPEILGDAAAYMDPLSVTDMAKVITKILRDPTQRDTLRHKGRERIKHYNWTYMSQKIVQIYNTCAP